MSVDEQPSDRELCDIAAAVLRAESGAVASMQQAIGPLFVEAARRVAAVRGAVVCSGVGKAGHVARKLSATLASTGTPSHFLNPADALHGDSGSIRPDDLLLLLSYSGESRELLDLLNLIKALGNPVIAITASDASMLGRHADLALCMGRMAEACPLGLAPSATTTAMLALGDALALTVMKLRNFTAEQFARYHPAGALGRRLLKVEQAMTFRAGVNLPVAADDLTVGQVLHQVSAIKRRSGAVILVDSAGRLSGLFTDGDLRRALTAHPENLLSLPVRGLMTGNPKRVGADELAAAALAIMHRHRIDELPVVDDDGRPVGLIDVQDLMMLQTLERADSAPEV